MVYHSFTPRCPAHIGRVMGRGTVDVCAPWYRCAVGDASVFRWCAVFPVHCFSDSYAVLYMVAQ